MRLRHAHPVRGQHPGAQRLQAGGADQRARRIPAKNGKTQLRIAETEKYAHVTFFFSGGREEPFAGEERIPIPSPNVATYDLKPEMSAPESPTGSSTPSSTSAMT